MRGETYQIALITLGVAATALMGVFLYREIFPEYKIYQNDYVALEKFRSSYTGEAPPAFSEGVKQIVINAKDNGPPIIDRCISCHVALQIPAFSPTRLDTDINGKVVLDAKGNPVQVPNENYIWSKLDEKIADLRDEKVNQQLTAEGKTSEVKRRLQQAEELFSLKTAQVGEHIFDVKKVLMAHPLIGKETRPFEFHPVEEYGCVSCHNGNGRGLTTEKAHGPVFDGQYEHSEEGHTKHFLETDKENDPQFSKIFNSKPGESLIFQTTPIYVGAVMEAKCAQCHLSSPAELQWSLNSANIVTKHRTRNSNAVKSAYDNQLRAITALLLIRNSLADQGLEKTIAAWEQRYQDYSLPPAEHDETATQLSFLKKTAGHIVKPTSADDKHVLALVDKEIDAMTGSSDLTKKLEEETSKTSNSEQIHPILVKFLATNQNDPTANGTLFKISTEWNLNQEVMQHVLDTETSLKKTVNDQQFLTAVKSDIDDQMEHYHQGQNLFLSQACYACHRIDTFSRGGVGPDLTQIGGYYPWYIKHHIVWPQGDTPTSTMPNYRLDHDELEDLVTYLLGQTGEVKAKAGSNYKVAVQQWEAGGKLPWEEPISPAQIHDLRYSMTVFATEGCASCHRLTGFESNVGFSVQKDGAKPDYDTLYKEKQWFSKIFPETIQGSEIVAAIDKNSAEIDKHISSNVRQGSLLEEIEASHPGQIEALYSNFKFASRAKNNQYQKLAEAEKDPVKKAKILEGLTEWKSRVQRVLMMYIQEYGLGRLIGPRPNWSGIYRSDEWLLEHFKNPSAHVPNSIMPIFPFDESKFYALTNMLNKLGIKNRDAVREIWNHNGFSPALAAHIHCAQCHGEFLLGNGPVAEWIYPIPKNLRNPDFLRNMTKERIIQSITHGVKGTPMAPWGEVGADKPADKGIPVLNKQEIAELANWLFSSLPGGQVIRDSSDVPKWDYSPKDVLEELHREGNTLEQLPKVDQTKQRHGHVINTLAPELAALPKGEQYYASLSLPTGAQSPKAISEISISDVFEIHPPPIPGPDQHGYYIKKQYFTPDNLQAGREFFAINCAVCHGQDANGTGIRAEIMQDAKPRMLTNLDWANTHDDIYMLRSIKYGVPGTSMTPWGDFTSSLQRLQLVMFIRSLTEDTQRRDMLASAIYQAFDTMQYTIESARINEYTTLESIQKKYDDSKEKLANFQNDILTGKAQAKDATPFLEKEFELHTQLQHAQLADSLFVDLKAKVKAESDLYQEMGKALINRNIDDSTLQTYLQLIKLVGENRFSMKDKHLQYAPVPEEKIADAGKKIIANINLKIEQLSKEKKIEDGKIPTNDISKNISHLTAEINEYTKLKNLMISNLQGGVRQREAEGLLYTQLQEKLKITPKKE